LGKAFLVILVSGIQNFILHEIFPTDKIHGQIINKSKEQMLENSTQ